MLRGMEATWSDIAGWYDDLIRSGSGPHETAVDCLLELLPPSLAGQAVVDVGCGQGLATRALAGAGAARVVGVDSSPEMVAFARRHAIPPSVEYVVDDAQRLASLESGSFDGATCQLALMDIPDLDATLEALCRVLRPGGWFVFVIGHPCFLMPEARPTRDGDGLLALMDIPDLDATLEALCRVLRPGGWFVFVIGHPCFLMPEARPTRDGDGLLALMVRGYFEERFWRSENPQGVRRAGNHHRTLATYLNALVRAGLAVEEVAEPVAAGRLGAERPLYREVPIFFAARTRRSRSN
jgi:SAM-dependent methyltransferase